MRASLRDLARPLISSPSAKVADPRGLLALDWPRYLLARGWLKQTAYEAATPEAQHAAVALLSNGLSYPLTLARTYEALGRPARVTVIGARAEATMPAHIFQRECAWKGHRDGPHQGRACVQKWSSVLDMML